MAIQKPEWFPLDPAKFLSDSLVDSLTTTELGAALRLLCRQWLDGSIPDDLHLLARFSRLDEAAMTEAWIVLQKFFPITEPGKRANRFMWIKRESVIAELERKSDEGARLARKRWDAVRNANGNAVRNASRMPDAMRAGMQDQSRAEQTRPEKKTSTSNADASDQPVLAKDFETTDLELSLQTVWDRFMSIIGKNPKNFTFTEKRKSMGRARLRDLKQRGGSWENAINLATLCVERLKSSPWHNGKNPTGKKYLSWEILFRSTEQMEMWLDDERWNSAKGVA